VIRDDAPSFARTRSAEIGVWGRFQTGAVSHAPALSASYLNRDSGGGFTFAPSPHPTNIYSPAPIGDYLVPASAADVPKTSETTLSGFALADTLGFMNDRMLLTLGVRRQNVKATNFDETTGAVTSSYDASAWTPMVGLVAKATDDLSLYANYIEGLSQGTTVGSGFQNAGEVFPPYKTRQIEVGAKLQTGSFTNTLSLFQIEQPSTLTDNSTVPLPTLRLNGEQRNRGIEWATFGELTRSLRVLGGVTYLEGTLTRTQDGLEDGNEAAGTPPWMANLGLDWDLPGLPGLAVNGRVTYTSAQYVDSANTLELPSWTRLDLGARYATRLGGKPVVFRASVDNVFDKDYWQGVFFNGSVTLGAPRTYRLTATVDF
jgi:iron complex outermembrane receptor protein